MKQLTRPADLYKAPATEPEIVDVPPMQFVMVDGEGDPNTATQYREAIEALYGTAYGLKFMLKKAGKPDFHVSPLEGLWWAPDMKVFGAAAKASWRWTAMIMVPDDVTPADVERVRADLRRKRPSAAVEKLRLDTFHEGPAAQVMHVGPYSAEGPTIERLHAFIREHGFTFDGRKQKHHEIYLGDPRRAKPEKLRTVIRQPFVKKP
jgi:hypothetical protein